jgi:hypothetical protein
MGKTLPRSGRASNLQHMMAVVSGLMDVPARWMYLPKAGSPYTADALVM